MDNYFIMESKYLPRSLVSFGRGINIHPWHGQNVLGKPLSNQLKLLTSNVGTISDSEPLAFLGDFISKVFHYSE